MGLDWLYNPIAIPRDIFKGAANAVSGGNDSGGSPAPAPTPQPLPEPPKPEMAAEKGQELARKRKASTTQSVFTDPLGVSGQANIVRKTLTGQ